jgi:hypothetical protein
MSAVELVDTEVRDLVRREGIDPIAEPTLVRRLTEYKSKLLPGRAGAAS